MVRQRICIDTYVVVGYFDKELADATKPLFLRLEKKEIVFVVSDLLDLKLIEAPEKIRELLDKYSIDSFERILLTEEAIDLANSYIAEKVVGKTSLKI